MVYQVYPRSFADSNGDGIGDLDGLRDKLGYLELLGVDAIWLCPVTRSPMADHGYDVADPRDIDPLFGDLAAFDALIAEAHGRNIKVTMDLVPNHTSDQHAWFLEALSAAPGSAERARYFFRDGRGTGGTEPPNNWRSVFGGPAWTRITEPDGSPGQWYLHLFAPEQPDLNWDNHAVFDDLDRTLRFWLDRGVDGFRIDVAHGLAKPDQLPDMDHPEKDATLIAVASDDLRFDRDGVHEIHRAIRKVVDEYPGAFVVGEVWVDDDERFGRYVRPDELHLAFNFRLAQVDFDAEGIRAAIDHSMSAVGRVGASPTWTLSNHDVEREVTRYGGGRIGLDRARAMALVELALPGVVFLYNGSELGLPNVDLPDEALRDPMWERSGHTERGRDGCRVPIPWEGTQEPFGFSSDTTAPWLPMPADWSSLTVESQLEDLASTLSLYRTALELRRERPEASGDDIDWFPAPPQCLAFRRSGGLICVLNGSERSVLLPPGRILLSSAPIEDGKLPPNSAAWLV